MSLRTGIVLVAVSWILAANAHPLVALLGVLLVVLYGHFTREDYCGASHG